jgi:hypothetical protein
MGLRGVKSGDEINQLPVCGQQLACLAQLYTKMQRNSDRGGERADLIGINHVVKRDGVERATCRHRGSPANKNRRKIPAPEDAGKSCFNYQRTSVIWMRLGCVELPGQNGDVRVSAEFGGIAVASQTAKNRKKPHPYEI